PLFEQHKSVVTPERFAREQEEGHAKHVVCGCLFLTALVGRTALPGQILEIVPIGQAKFCNQPSDSFGLIGFELAEKEFFEGEPAKSRVIGPASRRTTHRSLRGWCHRLSTGRGSRDHAVLPSAEHPCRSI